MALSPFLVLALEPSSFGAFLVPRVLFESFYLLDVAMTCGSVPHILGSDQESRAHLDLAFRLFSGEFMPSSWS